MIEAILIDHDFALHSMQFDYAAWTCALADEIEREERRPDDAEPGRGSSDQP